MKQSEEQREWVASMLLLDYWLLGSAILLFCVGLATIYSATLGWKVNFFARQFVWGIFSALAFLVTLRIGYSRLLRWGHLIYGICLLALAGLLISGHVTRGAQSWYIFGPLRLQPAEFVKVGLALFLSRFLFRHPPKELATFLWALVLAGAGGALILLQPDMGSALVYGFMTLIALFVSGAPWQYIAGLLGCLLASFPLVWLFLADYQKLRLLTFFDPSIDPLGAGYNVIQSRIAVGSGGLLGKGFLAGTQSKLRFLPEPHTDFAFSVFAEEFGFIGGAIMIALYVLLIWRMVKIGLAAKDVRAKVLVAMLSAWFWLQATESIMMSVGLAPVTGLPLPFVSYGGSSLLASAIALACVESVHLSTLKKYE